MITKYIVLAKIRRHFAKEQHIQGILTYVRSDYQITWQEFNKARQQGMRSATWKVY